jgi:hypothetical protein
MNGKELLVDTNIILYLLKGNDTLKEMLQGKVIHISFITELELIGFSKMSSREEQLINELLNDCVVVSLTNRIKEVYKTLRKAYPLKLADAVIAATSVALNMPLISADKQFASLQELMLIKYEV